MFYGCFSTITFDLIGMTSGILIVTVGFEEE